MTVTSLSPASSRNRNTQAVVAGKAKVRTGRPWRASPGKVASGRNVTPSSLASTTPLGITPSTPTVTARMATAWGKRSVTHPCPVSGAARAETA